MSKSVHHLKVALREVEPPVWRRIALQSEVTLGELAAVLEGAMGWEGYHLHLLEIDGNRYAMQDPELETNELDERQFRLGSVLSGVGTAFRWEYDFGTRWEHDVVVEAITPAESGVQYPVCLDGQHACPPEDCGGPGGYAFMLEVLADPEHPDDDGIRDWVPAGFDPTQFDRNVATEAMRSPRPSR